MISRRTALKALGVAMAPALLDAMAGPRNPRTRQAAVAPGVPLLPDRGLSAGLLAGESRRFLGEGALPPTLEPLRPVLGECLLLDGLDNRNVFSTPGPAHGKEASGWLTAIPAVGGGVISNAITADQIAAQRLGATPPSLARAGDHAYPDERGG